MIMRDKVWNLQDKQKEKKKKKKEKKNNNNKQTNKQEARISKCPFKHVCSSLGVEKLSSNLGHHLSSI